MSTLCFIGYFLAWNISHLSLSKLGAANWIIKCASLQILTLHKLIAWEQVPWGDFSSPSQHALYVIYFNFDGLSSRFDSSQTIVHNVKFDPWPTFPLVVEILRRTKCNYAHDHSPFKWARLDKVFKGCTMFSLLKKHLYFYCPCIVHLRRVGLFFC